MRIYGTAPRIQPIFSHNYIHFKNSELLYCIPEIYTIHQLKKRQRKKKQNQLLSSRIFQFNWESGKVTHRVTLRFKVKIQMCLLFCGSPDLGTREWNLKDEGKFAKQKTGWGQDGTSSAICLCFCHQHRQDRIIMTIKSNSFKNVNL